MRITVIGTGYVGLVTGTCFSELGFPVTCVDRNAEKIATLQQGKVPFFEPELAEMVAKNIREGRLQFATDLKQSAKDDVVFIAVGTPPGADGLPDVSALGEVVEAITTGVHKKAVIVIKSTMPPGTVKRVSALLPEHDVVSNPEFLREGSAIADFMNPDRVVVGTVSARAKKVMEMLYATFTAQLFFTTPESSEMIKYASNDLLATRIAYINEMADICEKVGADIEDVARGMGLDKRIGPQFLRPGPGFGGSCFPKDVLAMVKIAKRAGTQTRLLEATLASNQARKEAMAEKIIAAMDGVEGKTITILGLTFKPNTDDMREAPSLVILPALLKAGAHLRAFDPEGMEAASALLKGDITWCNDEYDALNGADAAVILTEWYVFRALDLPRAKALLSQKLIIDLRNIFEPRTMQEAGLRYVSVGREEVGAEKPAQAVRPKATAS